MLSDSYREGTRCLVFSNYESEDTSTETPIKRSPYRDIEQHTKASGYKMKNGLIIQAIIERGADGLYSVYSDAHIGDSYLGGFGKSVAEAKADFNVSIKEAVQEEAATGHPTPDPEDIEVEYRYDIPSFFNFFDFINVSKFAEFAGINESKMRAYKSGVAYPGEKTMAKIARAVKTIGSEISSAVL